MTLDDLERKIGILWIFWLFWAVRHISRANCTEINWDKQGQAVYKIFSIEHRFWRSKSLLFRFKETCARWHQRVVPLRSYFTVVGQSFMKTVADDFGHADYHNKH